MRNGQALSLLALRASLGALMIVWGLDKLVNPAHGVAVASHFYFGLLDSASVIPALGVAQLALGLLVVAGLARRLAYPVLAGVTGMTLLGVWRSVVDPWGWMLEGTNALFFPSLIIFAGVLVLLAFQELDTLSLDAARRGTMHHDRSSHAAMAAPTSAPRTDAHPAHADPAPTEHRSR